MALCVKGIFGQWDTQVVSFVSGTVEVARQRLSALCICQKLVRVRVCCIRPSRGWLSGDTPLDQSLVGKALTMQSADGQSFENLMPCEAKTRLPRAYAAYWPGFPPDVLCIRTFWAMDWPLPVLI